MSDIDSTSEVKVKDVSDKIKRLSQEVSNADDFERKSGAMLAGLENSGITIPQDLKEMMASKAVELRGQAVISVDDSSDKKLGADAKEKEMVQAKEKEEAAMKEEAPIAVVLDKAPSRKEKSNEVHLQKLEERAEGKFDAKIAQRVAAKIENEAAVEEVTIGNLFDSATPDDDFEEQVEEEPLTEDQKKNDDMARKRASANRANDSAVERVKVGDFFGKFNDDDFEPNQVETTKALELKLPREGKGEVDAILNALKGSGNISKPKEGLDSDKVPRTPPTSNDHSSGEIER